MPVCNWDCYLAAGKKCKQISLPCLCCALNSLQVQESWLLVSGYVLTSRLQAFFKWLMPLPHSLLVNKVHSHLRFNIVFSIQRHNTVQVSGFSIPPNPHCCPVCVVMETGHTQKMFSHLNVVMRAERLAHTTKSGNVSVYIQYCAKLLGSQIFLNTNS